MLSKRNLIYTLLLSYLLCIASIGQTRSNNQKLDSLLNSDSKFKIQLNDYSNLKSPLLSLKQLYTEGNYWQHFYFPNFEDESSLEKTSMVRLRNEINQSMQIFRKGENKYHLGIVSDVLGIIGPAAAAGLAVYHLHKYKKYYGIK